MPKVSVVVSTFNRHDMLKRAVDSVLAQTFSDWELIIVDDHSSDWKLSNDYLLALKDKRIKYTILPANSGSDTHPKNVGISLATGDYVAFLDDDNVYRPDHLAALVKELDNDDKLDCAYGDRWFIDDNGKLAPQIGVFSEKFDPFVLLQKQNFIDTSDVLIRRQALFDVGGWDETQKKYVDWNLWVRLYKAGKTFKRVPLILTDYHHHENTKSNLVKTDNEKKAGGGNIPDWNPIDCKVVVPFLKVMEAPVVAVYSLTKDRLDYTKKCFQSLYDKAGWPFKHVIVDNGSTDGTIDYLKDLEKKNPNVHVIYNEKNVGISKASNQAVDYIQKNWPSNIIGKVDNDCLFLNDGWMKKIVEMWETNHMIAYSLYVQGLRDNPGGAPRLERGRIADEEVGLTAHLGGICCFTDSIAYKDFRWPENSFLHGEQDREFSQYLGYAGFKMAYLENWFCEHYEGTTGQEKHYPEYFEKRKLEKSTRYEADKQPSN